MPIAKSAVSSASWRSPSANWGKQAYYCMGKPASFWKWNKIGIFFFFVRERFELFFSNFWTLLLHWSAIPISESSPIALPKNKCMCSLVLLSTDGLDPYLLWCYRINIASFCFCQWGHLRRPEEGKGGKGFVKAIVQVPHLSHGTHNTFMSFIRQ